MGIPTDILCKIIAWKSAEQQAYCCALVRAGLDQLIREIPYFASDDVPEKDQPQSPGVPGGAIKILVNAGIIENYHGSHPEEGIHYGRKSSRRENAHRRGIDVYRIVSVPMARKFLNLYQVEAPELQLSFL